MLFLDEALSDHFLLDLAEQIIARPAPVPNPLQCDRWVARSALQKCVRRGEIELAQRALANLFEHDRRAAWRHIAIIAIEDVGVANIDVVTRIIAAYRDRSWRQHVGGDWRVMAELVRQMASSQHCQAACDLLLQALNDPTLENQRMTALDANPATTSQSVWDSSVPLKERAIAALAIGGGLAEGQPFIDPAAVFDILAECCQSKKTVATCRAAWKLTRNPMSILLPLMWEQWMLIGQDHFVEGDVLPPVQMLGDVPGYALDRFTRVGNAISRALLRADSDLRRMLIDAGVASGSQSKTVGDMLFLAEGGLLKDRIRWPVGDLLRLPHRQLGMVASTGSKLPVILAYLRQQNRQIALLRQQHFYSLDA